MMIDLDTNHATTVYLTMWKERLSGYSTPSTLPPSRPRSQSPAPRGSSHLAPWDPSRRPNLSPRSSSLSLISNVSTAHQQLLNESSAKESSGASSSVNAVDPLDVLERILHTAEDGSEAAPKDAVSAKAAGRPGALDGDLDQLGNIDFGERSLRAFAEAAQGDHHGLKGVHVARLDSISECM